MENISLFLNCTGWGSIQTHPISFRLWIEQTHGLCKKEERVACYIETEVHFCSLFPLFLSWHLKIDATDTCTYVKQVFCIHPSIPSSHLYLRPFFCLEVFLLFIFCLAQLQTFQKFVVELYLSRTTCRLNSLFLCRLVSRIARLCVNVFLWSRLHIAISFLHPSLSLYPWIYFFFICVTETHMFLIFCCSFVIFYCPCLACIDRSLS